MKGYSSIIIYGYTVYSESAPVQPNWKKKPKYYFTISQKALSPKPASACNICPVIDWPALLARNVVTSAM